MRARAPGKVVISGAYAVLWGAPALVTAVDRYVVADSSRPPSFIAPEVEAAMQPPFPDFDASALRDAGRKLGLGSSAAILAASLLAKEPPAQRALTPDSDAGRAAFERCLRAHRQAQGGGSGIDVAASLFGGTLEYQLEVTDGDVLNSVAHVTARPLPKLHFELWAADRAASTSEFLARIRAFRAADTARHDALMKHLVAAAHAARDACVAGHAAGFASALAEQSSGLLELGRAAGVPIFIEELIALRSIAQRDGGVVLPAGAGGGDIALYVGQAPPSAALGQALSEHGHRPLNVAFGAAGAELIG